MSLQEHATITTAIATTIISGGRVQAKIWSFPNDDFFISKTFTCVFLKTIKSKQIFSAYHSNCCESRMTGCRNNRVYRGMNLVYNDKETVVNNQFDITKRHLNFED